MSDEAEAAESFHPNYDPRKSCKGFTVAARIQESGFVKLEALIKELQLDTKSPKIRIVGQTEDDMGTDRAKDSSIERYEHIWRAFLDYCFLVGDYESAMLPARNHCPADPLPVKSETAKQFLAFRCLEKRETVKNTMTNQPVKDIDGNVMISIGDWKGESSIGLFRTALSKLHVHYDTTKCEYTEACAECQKIPIERVCKSEGCRTHPGNPKYWRRGNVSNDKSFAEAISNYETYVLNHYEARRTKAFLPGELRDIRTHLLSFNDLYHLMIWTILIVAIKLFLRIEEALEMTVEQFETEYFIVTEDDVEGLCVRIKGKRDKVPLDFALWNDKECPEFSACQAILIWISLSGIKSGKLFPQKEDLGKGESFTTNYSYSAMLEILKSLSENVCGHDTTSTTIIYGTHMARKTAFLLAYWGFVRKDNCLAEMDKANILLSARHKDISSTATYLSNSGTLKSLVDRLDKMSERHRVGQWEPIHIKTHDSFASLNMESMKFQKRLPDLSDWYVHEMLGIPRDSRVSIAEVHRRVCMYTPNLTYEEEFRKELEKELAPAKVEYLLSLSNKATQERIKAALNPLVMHPSAPNTIVAVANDSEQPPAKKRKPNPNELVSCNRDYQAEFKATARNKKDKQIEIFTTAVKDVQAQVKAGKILCDPLKTFVYRYGKVVDCIESCHKGNAAEFLAANSGLAFSKFSCCSCGIKHAVTFDAAKI